MILDKPVLTRFRIGDMSFTDVNDLNAHMQRQFDRVALRHLLNTIDIERSGTGLCGAATAPTSDADCDEELPTFKFAIRRDSQLWGGWFLYNVKTLRETDTVWRVSAYPAPGIPYRSGGPRWREDMATIMRGFLNGTMLLNDGREFKLREWEFPTDDRAHHWRGSVPVEALRQDLRADFDEEERTADGQRTLKRIRRRDA